jgi:hypothetical protein
MKSYYLIGTSSYFANPRATPDPVDYNTLKSSRTFVEEKAREHLADWFLNLQMSDIQAKLTMTVRKGAHQHAPDFAGFKRWLTTHDF